MYYKTIYSLLQILRAWAKSSPYIQGREFSTDQSNLLVYDHALNTTLVAIVQDYLV